jgi:GLPGLI family protein
MNINLIRSYLLITIVLTLFTTAGRAQNVATQRIIYDFTFQRDTSDVNSKNKEPYALDIYPGHSKFVSFTKLKSDSYIDSLTKAIDAQGGIQNIRAINFSGMGQGARYEIYKFTDGKIRYQQKFLKDLYGYEENMSSLNWTILDSSSKYGQYNCQLAKTRYGGRNWTALFTTDVPINNGPYKFSGLPGLIVKIWDDQQHCLFELAEVKNVTDGNATIPKAEIVEKTAFRQVEENAQNQIRSMGSGVTIAGNTGGTTVTRSTMRDQNGNEISPEEMQRRRATMQNKNNNRLELP